jgi:uncharacterized DUF497 family protein
VRFEWDALKASANLSKHGVDFADATIALEDSLAATIPDPNSRDEDDTSQSAWMLSAGSSWLSTR